MITGKLGKRNLLGFQWVPLAKFKRDTVMMARGTSVSVEMLIKFVRHKLGGAHFDNHSRREWQRELIAMSRYWEDDKDFLNHHMREVLRAVCEGITENRVEQHAGE
jgi:hypothetical protein